MLVVNILLDGFFAAIAGMGFGSISDTPIRSYKYIAILAATGHALRYVLMTTASINIAFASLMGSLVIGFGALWLGKKAYTPITVLYIPALLPMIPGKYAYNMFLALIMFLQNINNAEARQVYMNSYFFNSTVALTVIFLLAAGATLPILLFPKRTFSLTRRAKPSLKKK